MINAVEDLVLRVTGKAYITRTSPLTFIPCPHPHLHPSPSPLTFTPNPTPHPHPSPSPSPLTLTLTLTITPVPAKHTCLCFHSHLPSCPGGEVRGPAPFPHFKEVAVVSVVHKVLQHGGQVEVDYDWSLISHPVEGPAHVHAPWCGW